MHKDLKDPIYFP